MPFLALILLALTVACAVGALTWRYPRIAAPAPAPALGAARALGKTAGAHPSLRGVLVPRLDPEAATGLALTLALLFTVAGGVLLGLLAYLVRTNSHLIGFDNGVAKWGVRHASAFSTHGLNAVTQLASIYTVVGLCVVLAVTETLRTRSRWILPFLLAAVGGEELLTVAIKHLVNRVRPAFNPAAATLGPAFPSGHAATAAAFYATAALLIGRQRGHTARALLAGLAAGIAVAVAASRVLLDVHWLTDVIAGLALGWAWFAVCTIAFGGRLLRFGVAAEVAGRVADVTESAETDGNRESRATRAARAPNGGCGKLFVLPRLMRSVRRSHLAGPKQPGPRTIRPQQTRSEQSPIDGDQRSTLKEGNNAWASSKS